MCFQLFLWFNLFIELQLSSKVTFKRGIQQPEQLIQGKHTVSCLLSSSVWRNRWRQGSTHLWCRSLCAAWWEARRSPTGWTGWWGSGPISLQEPIGDSESASHREKDPPPVKRQYIRLRSEYMTQNCFYQWYFSSNHTANGHRSTPNTLHKRKRENTK